MKEVLNGTNPKADKKLLHAVLTAPEYTGPDNHDHCDPEPFDEFTGPIPASELSHGVQSAYVLGMLYAAQIVKEIMPEGKKSARLRAEILLKAGEVSNWRKP